MSRIETFRARADGPARMRAELRRSIRSANRLLQSARSVQAMKTTIPQSIFGGDVLALMSDRLRRFLQDNEPETAALEVAGRSAAFPPGASERGPGHAAAPAATSEPGRPALGKLSAEPAPVPSFSDVPQGARRAQFHAGLHDESGARRSFSSPEYETRGERSFLASPPPPLHARNSAAQPALVKKLNEYWSLSRQERSERKSGPISANATTAGLSDSAGLSRNDARPTMTLMPARHMAERLRAFVAGRSLSSVRLGEPADKPGQSETAPAASTAPPPHLEISTRELSDLMADILREQAIQHGVDIT